MEKVKETKKNTEIYEAIKRLPKELITKEIWEAAIEEGKVELLNILPDIFQSEENINKILDKNNSSYSWQTFNLANIPEQFRTEKVCTAAVNNDLKNYKQVPEKKRNNQMLLKIMASAESNLHYLPMVPVTSWNENAAYKGISSIFLSSKSSSYNSRYSSGSSSDKSEQMKLIQILLHYVPDELKTEAFYMGLFQTSMSVEHIDQLIPKKFKTDTYYLEVAKKNIKQVPSKRLNYNIILTGLLSEKNHISDFFKSNKEENPIQKAMFELMDDAIVEAILKKDPYRFRELPDRFHTKSKLLFALNETERSVSVERIYDIFNVSQFDDDICRAIIRKDSDCPNFAPAIWTTDFVDYCMKHARGQSWFVKMPKELQTQEIVDVVINESLCKLQYVRKELISYDLAVKAFRQKTSSYREEYDYREFVPSHYVNDFVLETGLPKEFFGGEVSYSEVREIRNNYTYCQIGDCYLGFFEDKDYNNTYNRLIMTRRTPSSIKPGIVFSRKVDTFHKTWFEKLISEFDPQFTKPTPANGMKLYQLNPYFEVKQGETISGQKTYINSLLGAPLYYSVNMYGEIHLRTSIDSLKKLIQEEINKKNEMAEAC